MALRQERVTVSRLSVLRDGRSVIATTVAGTATVDIEAYFSESSAWHVIHSQSVTTDGSIMIRDDHGHYEKIRANISSYTSGTHSVYASGTVDSL